MKRKMMEWVVSALGSKKRYVGPTYHEMKMKRGADDRWDLLNLNLRRIRN